MKRNNYKSNVMVTINYTLQTKIMIIITKTYKMKGRTIYIIKRIYSIKQIIFQIALV